MYKNTLPLTSYCSAQVVLFLQPPPWPDRRSMKLFSFLLLSPTISSAVCPLPHRGREGKAFFQLCGKKDAKASTILSDALYWDHLLDNFDSTVEGNTGETFQSRYYVDSTNYRPGGPYFLYIGGEGPLSGPANGFIQDLAASHGARIYSLEHRFYGESLPQHSIDIALSVEYLQFHTVDQSLFDLAAFIDFINSSIAPDEGIPEWFAVGGSYPGALSSWFRIAYPNHTVASLSSSGVVNALFEFPEFDQQVATSAGEQCANAIRASTTALETAMNSNSTATKVRDRRYWCALACSLATAPCALQCSRPMGWLRRDGG